ncbi:MAG: response regulator [Clostridiales bacterium]|nr:response regulator [Clostridiales bacterium]
MLKVFLVEDEIVMREGIKNNIPWEEEGFDFVGEASDGELAYPMIQKLRPDIIITDIKMPFMDGLELSRLVKKDFPDVSIIILSGYDEFEYAKEAIKIGVTEYLVKPVSSAKLLEVVKEIGNRIEKENEKKKYLEQFKKEMKEMELHEKEKFLHEILSGKISMSELLEKGKKLNIHLAAGVYNVVLFMMRESEDTDQAYSKELAAAWDAIMELAEQTENIYMFNRSIDGVEFLLLDESRKQLEEKRADFLKKLMDISCEYGELQYFGGVGNVVNRLREVHESYESASKAFSYRYLLSYNRIVYAEQMEEMRIGFGEEDADIDLKELDFGKIDRRIIKNFLGKGLLEEVSHFIEDYFLSLGTGNVESMLFRQYITTDMYFGTVAFVEELGYNADNIIGVLGDFKTISEVLPSVEKTKEYLKNMIRAAMNLRDQISVKKYGSLIDDAKAYIEKNFDSEDISLNSVATHVNISSSHFSSIFSQEEGQTFIEYLTELRMNKAKELLMCSSLKSSEIGYAVGYKDPHYFSYLFKKTQNVTPKEYRMRGKVSSADNSGMEEA